MKTKNNTKYIIIIFILSRILFLLSLFRHSLILFDSHSYIKIAQFGYIENYLYAFFPLYPILIKTLHFIIPFYVASGMIISNISTLLAAFILCSLVKKEKTKNTILLLFIFSPILGFTTICYTEGLYLLLTILAFYYYKKNKVISGIFIGLSMLTRNTGIILLGAFTLELLIKWFKKKVKFKEILLLVTPAILIGFLYSIYLWITINNPFMYITVQSTEWGRVSCNIFTLLVKDIKYTITNHESIYLAILNWLFIGIAIYHSIKNIKKDFALSIYVIVSIILFATTCRVEPWQTLPSVGLFRYVFSLFPIYLFLVNVKEDKKIYKYNLIMYILISLVNASMLYANNFIA